MTAARPRPSPAPRARYLTDASRRDEAMAVARRDSERRLALLSLTDEGARRVLEADDERVDE